MTNAGALGKRREIAKGQARFEMLGHSDFVID
jgi:hypothetical protein